MERLHELVRLDDLERLYKVKLALESRGIEAAVWGRPSGRWRLPEPSGEPRLMVRQRDLVYARWVAHAAGLDVWPDAPDAGEDRGAEAPSTRGRQAA
jgi:hypothetical protein